MAQHELKQRRGHAWATAGCISSAYVGGYCSPPFSRPHLIARLFNNVSYPWQPLLKLKPNICNTRYVTGYEAFVPAHPKAHCILLACTWAPKGLPYHSFWVYLDLQSTQHDSKYTLSCGIKAIHAGTLEV